MRACSTGSPASTRSTKLTPLTTRPSLTSRQGMTRAFSMSGFQQLERAGDVDASVVERAAADDALDPGALLLLDLFQIGQGGNAARSDDRRGQRKGEIDGGLEI